MDKRIFDGVLGISCLENYVLGILKTCGIDISRLYCRSLINTQKLYDDVFIKNMTYANYREIPSIHSIAKQLGVIKFIFAETNPGFDLMLKLKKLSKGEYLLVRVKQDYIKAKYNSKLWRDDHYMLVFINAGEIHFINDTPRAEGTITQEELLNAYDNGYMWIRVLNPVNIKMVDKSMINFIELFQCTKTSYLFENTTYVDNDMEVKAKNILLIYRISLQRTIEFLSLYFDLSNFKIYITELNKILAKLEYDIIKKNINICGSNDTVLLIFRVNLLFYEEIQKKMSGGK